MTAPATTGCIRARVHSRRHLMEGSYQGTSSLLPSPAGRFVPGHEFTPAVTRWKVRIRARVHSCRHLLECSYQGTSSLLPSPAGRFVSGHEFTRAAPSQNHVGL